MKDFSYFLRSGDVRQQLPDPHTAKATAADSSDRLELASRLLGKEKPKFVLENAYEAVREMIDAILFLRGYKSFSHEAAVAYLFILGFSPAEAAQVDALRRKRNGTKYYGESAAETDAKKALATAGDIIKKLHEKVPQLA